MKTERTTSQSIDDAAADWTARLDCGALTPEEDAAFQAWLSGDPRSRGAFLRAQAVFMMSESAQALGPRYDPADFEASRAPLLSRISRRQAFGWSGAAVAAAAVIGFGIAIPAAGAVVTTGRGEIRLVPLDDGSTVMLNTETSVRIHYDAGARVVTLLRGEAYFSVARDEKRPFLVEVVGRRLRAVQATFRVRQLKDQPIDVLVHQGRVDLASRSGGIVGMVTIESNMRLQLATTGLGETALVEKPQLVGPDLVSRELAWREGKIAFEGETLGQAADTFARYSDTRILIRDPALAREPVTGLFAANDPVGFSRAVASVFDARVERTGETLILSRNAAAH